jgi:hypothetical protein
MDSYPREHRSGIDNRSRLNWNTVQTEDRCKGRFHLLGSWFVSFKSQSALSLLQSTVRSVSAHWKVTVWPKFSVLQY